MRVRRHGAAAIAITAGILAVAACGGSDDSGGEPAAEPPATTTADGAPASTGDPAPAGPADAPLQVTGEGFALLRSDVGDGLYVGALVENPSSRVVAGQSVEFDLLDASGAVLGQAEPAEIDIAPGGTGAAGTTGTPADCGCDLTDVATVRARLSGDPGRIDPADAAIPLFQDATVATGGGALTISGTLVNATGLDLDPLDTARFVVSDAGGAVLGGGDTSIGVEVAAGETVPVTLTPPASFGASLARPPATVAVSIG